MQGAATQLRLFDTMVSTVLSYGVEVWGPQLIAAGRECAATRLQLSFLRHLLGVRMSTPTLVVLAETAAPGGTLGEAGWTVLERGAVRADELRSGGQGMARSGAVGSASATGPHWCQRGLIGSLESWGGAGSSQVTASGFGTGQGF